MYTVVAAYFHGQEGYILQVTGNIPDTIYMELKQIILGHNFPPEWTERQIFLVECKPPTSEFPVELDDNTFSHQVWNEPSTRMYGTIAIGKKVKFYTFNGTAVPGQRVSQYWYPQCGD
jgi:hypothetical protein